VLAATPILSNIAKFKYYLYSLRNNRTNHTASMGHIQNNTSKIINTSHTASKGHIQNITLQRISIQIILLQRATYKITLQSICKKTPW